MEHRSTGWNSSLRHPSEGWGPIVGMDSSLRWNDGKLEEVTLSATVSKGTYIRSLARDIARALGSVGHVVMLRRTRAGPFGLDSAISLDFLDRAAKARDLTRTVLPLEAALDDIPALPVTPEQALLLRHGQRLVGTPAAPGLLELLGDLVAGNVGVEGAGLARDEDAELPAAPADTTVGSRALSFRPFKKVPLLLARSQTSQPGARSGQPGAQTSLPRLGQRERPDDQAPLPPAVRRRIARRGGAAGHPAGSRSG